jgi:hypothetical protein
MGAMVDHEPLQQTGCKTHANRVPASRTSRCGRTFGGGVQPLDAHAVIATGVDRRDLCLLHHTRASAVVDTGDQLAHPLGLLIAST